MLAKAVGLRIDQHRTFHASQYLLNPSRRIVIRIRTKLYAHKLHPRTSDCGCSRRRAVIFK